MRARNATRAGQAAESAELSVSQRERERHSNARERTCTLSVSGSARSHQYIRAVPWVQRIALECGWPSNRSPPCVTFMSKLKQNEGARSIKNATEGSGRRKQPGEAQSQEVSRNAAWLEPPDFQGNAKNLRSTAIAKGGTSSDNYIFFRVIYLFCSTRPARLTSFRAETF